MKKFPISLLVLAAALAITPTAFADSIIAGNDTVPRSYVDTYYNFVVIDSVNPAQTSALITGWNIYAANTLPVELLIYKPDGGDNYTLMGESALMTPAVGVNSFILTSPIPMEPGDVVGLYFASTGSVPFDYTTGATVFHYTNPNSYDLTVGSESYFNPLGERTYSVDVTGLVIPEPSTLFLLGTGLFGMAGLFARRVKAARGR